MSQTDSPSKARKSAQTQIK
uniref:Uncharacterized protein n=1 Tax=Arundo donax TaxID=35708 RepID=A0A0A9B3T0_ARUDO